MAKQVETSVEETAVAVAPSAPAPAHHLIVIHPFASFQKGELINDADKIADVLAGENAHHCNRVFPS